jgi:hypothetical protein
MLPEEPEKGRLRKDSQLEILAGVACSRSKCELTDFGNQISYL